MPIAQHASHILKVLISLSLFLLFMQFVFAVSDRTSFELILNLKTNQKETHASE